MNNFLTLKLGSQSKYLKEILRCIADEFILEVKKQEKTSGRGKWLLARGAHGARTRKPLRGISRHVIPVIVGSKLEIRGTPGHRSARQFLTAHDQGGKGLGMRISPKSGRRVLYVPLTKKASQMTAFEAYANSSRFGGSLLEGKIIDGVTYYYDPRISKGEKGRLVEGKPDFLWLPEVFLPRRNLFDRRAIPGIVKRGLTKALRGSTSPLLRKRVSYELRVH